MQAVTSILFGIYWVVAWRSLNDMQNMMGLTFFTTFEGYMRILFMKGSISALLGWLVIPIVLIHKLVKGRPQ